MDHTVADQLKSISDSIPPHVQLIAVSKVHPVEHIMKAYAAGHRDFGENKVQEMVAKAERMPQDIQWHLIGHLQRNKVKYIIDFVHLIHSVDSLKLLNEIEKRAAEVQRRVNVLLQIHIAEEESKFGLNKEECLEILDYLFQAQPSSIRVKGLMGMATFTSDELQVQREFHGLNEFFSELKLKYQSTDFWQPEVLSMGMSGDYPIAIAEGSNMIRVGSLIFGERTYN